MKHPLTKHRAEDNSCVEVSFKNWGKINYTKNFPLLWVILWTENQTKCEDSSLLGRYTVSLEKQLLAFRRIVAPLPSELPETADESITGSSQRHETIYPTEQRNISEKANFGKATCVTSDIPTRIFFCRNVLKWDRFARKQAATQICSCSKDPVLQNPFLTLVFINHLWTHIHALRVLLIMQSTTSWA